MYVEKWLSLFIKASCELRRKLQFGCSANVYCTIWCKSRAILNSVQALPTLIQGWWRISLWYGFVLWFMTRHVCRSLPPPSPRSLSFSLLICNAPKTYTNKDLAFLSLSPPLSLSSPPPHSGELRTQKFKSHLVRTQTLNVLPLKPGVDQYIPIHATLTARDFFLAYFYPSSPFTCIFSKTSPNFFLCWPAE